jgi:hypothetical protein
MHSQNRRNNKCLKRSKLITSFYKKGQRCVIRIYKSYNSNYFDYIFSPSDGPAKDETCCFAVPWAEWTPLTE